MAATEPKQSEPRGLINSNEMHLDHVKEGNVNLNDAPSL